MSSENCKIIVAFNPIEPAGYVYKAEHQYKWTVIEMSALNHPNVLLGAEVIPGAITRTQIDSNFNNWSKVVSPTFPNAIYVPWRKEYFEPTAQVLTRVCGRYHLMSYGGFIDPKVCEGALHDGIVSPDSRLVAVGLDLSKGMRDRTILSEVYSDGKAFLHEIYHNDLMDLARKVHESYPQDSIPLGVDDTGVGSGVTSRLKERGRQNVYGIQFSESPEIIVNDKQIPHDTKTAMVQVLEQQMRQGFLRIPNDPVLLRELTSLTLYSTYGGKYWRVVEKSKLRKKLRASTDKTDSLCIGVYTARLHGMAVHKFIW